MLDFIMPFVWLGLLILFAVVELATAQLTTVWFAVAALVSLLLSAFGIKSITIQVIVFTVVSVVSLVLSRPIVRKYINKRMQPTNADRNIGMTALVTEDIDNIAEVGAVKINGIVWSARSLNGNVIAANSLVKIVKIDGVKLIVEEQ